MLTAGLGLVGVVAGAPYSAGVARAAGLSSRTSIWRPVPIPSPDSGTSLTAAALSGLACTAPIDCTAVGQLQFGTNSLPIAEHWDGRTWSSDNVASAAAENNLAGVSCSSAVFCVAVGSTGPYAEPIKQPSSSSGTGQHGQASRHPTQGMSLNPRWDRQWSAEASWLE